MAHASRSSSSKALKAILPQIEEGHAYEAHQKARTFASRYVKSQQYDTAIEVLFESAKELLKKGQKGSGTDLGSFMLEVYESKGQEVTAESRGRITQLIALTGSEESWRKTLIDKAIAWTVKLGPCPAGDRDLHHYLGELFYKEGSFELAEQHLLNAGKRDSGRILAKMMAEWWQGAGASLAPGPGAFALRGTLPHVLNGNILAAHAFVSTFVPLVLSAKPSLASRVQPEPVTIPGSGAGAGEILLTTDAALNFAQLVVPTCQRAQGDRNKPIREAWVRLCGAYLVKDPIVGQPEVKKALQEIGSLYFAIPLPRNQAANPFGDMLSSLLGGAPTSSAAPRVLMPGSGAAGLD